MKKNYAGFLMLVACGAVAAALCALLVASFSAHVKLVSGFSPEQGTVVVIDAGHGDFDPGAVSKSGIEEKVINLSIALKLRDIFVANGYTVAMTRTEDQTLAFNGPSTSKNAKTSDTHNRASFADSFADSVMISVHQNAFPDRSQHGTQIFHGVKNEQRSVQLAKAIMGHVKSKLQTENPREIKKGTDRIYILMHTQAPIVLVECGFMTNSAELERLLDEEYQKKIAYCIYLGYCDYLKCT
ncbi:MAG: N-acetylmuramoyl-L-alanine amidase [Oscillospiraceae bacterium]